MVQVVFSGLGNLIKFLPTGTFFLYQFLSPVLSNNGHCTKTIYKYFTAILVGMCGLSCFLSSFTDSYVGDDGKIHYGVVTSKGIWPPTDSENAKLPSYNLQNADFAHASLALIVFAILVLLDQKTVSCFYPVSESFEKTLFIVLPPVVGAVSSVVLKFFPYERHGIGYPLPKKKEKGIRCPSSSADSSKDSKPAAGQNILDETITN